jgi:lipoate-protein ligase A
VGRPLDLIAAGASSPAASLAADDVLRRRAATTGRAVLRVWTLPGDVLSLGRWHLTPPGGAGVRLLRRQTGGRVVPAGEGFVGLALALPHPAALVSDDPHALAPAQVPNRCVRGILDACTHAGVPAVYPGRDVVTVQGRIAAMVTFDVDAAGTCLFEAVLAVGRDFSLLPGLLDRADPTGVVRAPMLTPEHVTSLARELGGVPAFAQVVDWLRVGYADRLALAVACRALDRSETAEIEAATDDWRDGRWLAARRPPEDLPHQASVAIDLGFLDVRCRLRGDRLDAVLLSGDLIANAAGVACIEAALCGLQPERAAVTAAVEHVLQDPRHFLLGLGARPAATVAEAVMRAVRG